MMTLTYPYKERRSVEVYNAICDQHERVEGYEYLTCFAEDWLKVYFALNPEVITLFYLDYQQAMPYCDIQQWLASDYPDWIDVAIAFAESGDETTSMMTIGNYWF